MNLPLSSGALLRASRIGVAVVALMFFAMPFAAAPNAMAYPGYNVTLSCTTSNGGGSLQSSWKWYQGGTNGTLLASGSLNDTCPSTSGTNNAAVSGTQPANADTLSVFLEINLGGCGGFTGKDFSFAPGSSVLANVSLSANSPCKYAKSIGKTKVDADFTLQS